MSNNRHLSMEQIMRLVSTVRTLVAAGRNEDRIAEDLMQSHGLTRADISQLFKLV